MNFVTLKELKKMVPVVEEGKRPPSLKKILEEGTEVVLRKLMENHAEVVVYKNGYVSYQSHERSTVFSIHDCKHYHYESQGNEQQTIPQDHFEDIGRDRMSECSAAVRLQVTHGCVNNVPKKPRRIGDRWSVLDRLHIKQAERKQKEQGQQQQQERSRKN